MKPWVAFLAGSILAASIAIIVMKREPAADPAEGGPAAPTSQAVPAEVEPAPSATAHREEPVAGRSFTSTAPSARKPIANVAPIQSPGSQAASSQAKGTPPVSSTPEASAVPSGPVQLPSPGSAAEAPPVAAERRAPIAPPPPAAPNAAPNAVPNKVTIEAGTPIIVRLARTISSDAAQDGQAFEATLDQPIIADGFAIAERGARVEGRIIDSEKAGRVKGVSKLSLELVRINTSDGQRVAVATHSWDKEGEQSKKQDAEKVALGAGVGAALGAIFGGGKGAAVGAGAGGATGGGVVLATRGKPVVLPVETKVTFRLRSAVTITERR